MLAIIMLCSFIIILIMRINDGNYLYTNKPLFVFFLILLVCQCLGKPTELLFCIFIQTRTTALRKIQSRLNTWTFFWQSCVTLVHGLPSHSPAHSLTCSTEVFSPPPILQNPSNQSSSHAHLKIAETTKQYILDAREL